MQRTITSGAILGTDVTNVGRFGVIASKGGSRVMQLALNLLFQAGDGPRSVNKQ